MRWILSERALALFLLVCMAASLSACGGSAADPTATPQTTATPTIEPTAEPTATPSPTPPPSPTATPEPTATPRPAIITTTPRPIATRPPAPTPTTSVTTVAGSRDVLVDDFEAGPGAFPAGSADDGSSLGADGGAYVMTVPEEYWLNALPVSPPVELTDGIISAEVAMTGDGFAGMIGRQLVAADGSETFLVCGLYSSGAAGCYDVSSAGANELLFIDAGTFETREINLLTLTVVDTWFAFDVNQRMLGEGDLAAEVSGNWGFYTESMAGTTTAAYQWVSIRNPVLVEETFDDGAPGPFYTGTAGDSGTTFAVVDGRFVVTQPGVEGGLWGYLPPDEMTPYADGLIETRATLNGNGASGVIARASVGADGLISGYVCQVYAAGDADCYKVVANEWTQLVAAPAGSFVATDLNTLTLRATGTQIQFAINAQIIGTIDDDAFELGEWGFVYQTFATDPAEQAVSAFDSVLIFDMGP